MNKFQKLVIKWIKIYVIASLVVFVSTAIVWGYVIVSNAIQSQKLIDAQVEYQKGLTSQIGKPQVVEQRYITK